MLFNYVGGITRASYTNLDPGKYVFRVKASNNDGVWNNEGISIKIIVHPPWWRTPYAYLLYALALISALLFIRHRSIQKIKRKFELEQERKEADRIIELDRLKIKFLTNLSHEFRTPISLILGPADQLLQGEKNEQKHGSLQLIKRNARRLLNLVNQLLDFRKMEEHELKLYNTKGELISFMREVSDSFKDLSERKKIDFAFISHIDELHTVFDHDKLERVLFNLLSNAFKFTFENGQVQLIVDRQNDASNETETWITIKVCDTGIGIPKDQQEKIFERFFQHTAAASILNQGTGIGLSITKEFVKMHGGTISFESDPGKGTTFTIQLPFTPLPAEETKNEMIVETVMPGINEEVMNDTGEEIPKPVPLRDSMGGKPSIMLVEDNDDFRFYLKDNLRLYYRVFEAANGKEGWQKTLAYHPQLIVSDVSMPDMSGIELTRKIKSDKRTKHIPVILLTALTGEREQLKGLETGANDYITKPFNFEMLNSKIRNLIVLNNTLQQTYAKQIKFLAPEVEIETEDEKLLQSILLYIEQNLTDPQLSVENLSQHLGMSRSSLYGKLLQLTGQTPVDYIRSIKLEKAAVLLEKSGMHVAQVAYAAGFSSPHYFAKAFKEKFNVTPSEYKINKQNEKKGKKEKRQKK